jgi:hypothetical protein
MAGIPWRGIKHDLSKFTPIEFIESAHYWTGNRSPIDNCKDVNGFSKAWQHHKGHNTHHWEYWIDDIKDGGVGHPKALLMPYKDTVELLCDYLGAGAAYMKDKFNAESELNWWLKKREEVLMHPVVKSFVNVIFLKWKNGTPIEELLNKKYLKKLYDDLVYDYKLNQIEELVNNKQYLEELANDSIYGHKLNQIIPKVKEESNGNDN